MRGRKQRRARGGTSLRGVVLESHGRASMAGEREGLRTVAGSESFISNHDVGPDIEIELFLLKPDGSVEPSVA
jgi:hypothetical protein